MAAIRAATCKALGRLVGVRGLHAGRGVFDKETIKFSSSPAFHGRRPDQAPAFIPAYQLKDPVIRVFEFCSAGISLAVFMIYFAYIRKENDIDAALDVKDPGKRMDEIEKQLLRRAIASGKAKGKDVHHFEARLEVLDHNKTQ